MDGAQPDNIQRSIVIGVMCDRFPAALRHETNRPRFELSATDRLGDRVVRGSAFSVCRPVLSVAGNPLFNPLRELCPSPVICASLFKVFAAMRQGVGLGTGLTFVDVAVRHSRMAVELRKRGGISALEAGLHQNGTDASIFCQAGQACDTEQYEPHRRYSPARLSIHRVLASDC